jgi:hypothetical protein
VSVTLGAVAGMVVYYFTAFLAAAVPDVGRWWTLAVLQAFSYVCAATACLGVMRVQQKRRVEWGRHEKLAVAAGSALACVFYWVCVAIPGATLSTDLVLLLAALCYFVDTVVCSLVLMVAPDTKQGK